jgi:hypothetical protein
MRHRRHRYKRVEIRGRSKEAGRSRDRRRCSRRMRRPTGRHEGRNRLSSNNSCRSRPCVSKEGWLTHRYETQRVRNGGRRARSGCRGVHRNGHRSRPRSEERLLISSRISEHVQIGEVRRRRHCDGSSPTTREMHRSVDRDQVAEPVCCGHTGARCRQQKERLECKDHRDWKPGGRAREQGVCDVTDLYCL